MKEINSEFFKGCPKGTTHVRNNFWHKLDKDKLYTYNTYRNDWNEEHDHLFFG